jgi:hypothetical protein
VSTRRRSGLLKVGRLGIGVVLLALTVVLGGCRGAEGPTISAREVLDRAATASRGLETVHFVLEVQGRVAALANGLEVIHAEGDLRRPNDAQMQVSLRAGGLVMDTELRLVEDRVYLYNPMAARFEELSGDAGLALLDPDRGLAAAVAELEAAEVVGVERESDVRLYRMRGHLPTRVLARMIGGTPLDERTMVEARIRESDWMLARLTVTGPALVGDERDAVRTIMLSKWGAPVEISRPPT